MYERVTSPIYYCFMHDTMRAKKTSRSECTTINCTVAPRVVAHGVTNGLYHQTTVTISDSSARDVRSSVSHSNES